MAVNHWRRCKQCGTHARDAGPISWRGLCGVCGTENLTENVVGLHTMTGPAVKRGRIGMVRCAGGYTHEEVAEMLDAVRRET